MYLRQLELHGFKTCAQKTVLEFLPSVQGAPGLTAIVGPNGSGKSNVADAVRWVMGEQSLKLLRAKKSEDVIFSGAPGKPRAGFAEVTMTILNQDAGQVGSAAHHGAQTSEHQTSNIDLPEIVIARRIYRDGQSEYTINKQPARLTDVTLLLAQCGVGQRTYSVIGQGMVDAVLIASPSERKDFFDEAVGLRVWQLKRQAAINKLNASRERLAQAKLLLQEIEPRLSSLERHVKRLRERENIEQELHHIEREYFGRVWADLSTHLTRVIQERQGAQAVFAQQHGAAEKLEQELAALARATPVSSELRDLQHELDARKDQRAKLREEEIRCESLHDVARARSETSPESMPISQMIQEVSAWSSMHTELHFLVTKDAPQMDRIRSLIEKLAQRSKKLLDRLQNKIQEDSNRESASHQDMQESQKRIATALHAIEKQIRSTEAQMEALHAREDANRTHLFDLQRRFTAQRRSAEQAERKVNSVVIEVAKLETRRDAFLQDLRVQAPSLEAELENLAQPFLVLDRQADENKGDADHAPLEDIHTRMRKLRSQLEWIGGIDPTTLTEHAETQARFTDLQAHVTDITQAISSLDIVIAELDTTITERREEAFQKLNREFSVFFKKLFGGGEAHLLQIQSETAIEATAEEEDDGEPQLDTRQEPIGIDIVVTPPGKRLKSVALLSGGERALTSIALICAILATHPSPFVVLDEVDAALDESNSKKFAEILGSLAHKTQFILITHNRATMSQAHVLYGVTMGEDGTSQLLSLQLEKK